MPSEGMTAEARWVGEAVRLYRRYEDEVVGACGLCPWAERVRQSGRVREHVFLHSDQPIEPSLEAIDELVASEVDIALFLYPRLALGRSAFETFAARVRDADVARQSLGCVPFVFAVFHPEATPDLKEPERLIPFLRRTPDPTIQLLRSSVLDQVRDSSPQGTQFVDPHLLNVSPAPVSSMRERIARANLATALRVGVDTLARRFDEIARDRSNTYGTLERAEALS
jgi:hypothetical protein